MVSIDPGSTGLSRLQNVMLSKKRQGMLTQPLKKLLVTGIVVGMVNWITPTAQGQHCDSPGCKCQQGHHGSHQDCKAVTVFDRIDSLADRLESGLDRVFGKVVTKKKHCNCAKCQAQRAGVVYDQVPVVPESTIEPGIEPLPEPDEPGIADPLPILTIEPNTKPSTGSGLPNASVRPRLPLKTTEPKREFPTSTDRGTGVPANVQPQQPAIELRPFERGTPPSTSKPIRDPGVIIPDWLEDPFKEDQSKSESSRPQRLLPPATTPSNDIRWSKRPTLEQQTQAAEPKKSEVVTKAEPKSEPVLRLNIGDQQPERAGGKITDRDDANVVKASSNQPIRITFPIKK
jgi:hypothetical protein